MTPRTAFPHCAISHSGPALRRQARRAQQGAALLMAMLIVTLVATLAAGMVWQQWRAIEVEGAERARTQSTWLLTGALDWARLILREDARDGGPDGLTEPWATGLEEIRLSTFLAADKDNTSDTGLDAFLSGQITDAQSRYNLRNLVEDDDEAVKAELKIITRLCEVLSLPSGVAQRLAEGMRGASEAEDKLDDKEAVATGAPLRPVRVEQLRWLGLDADTVQRLTPFVTILPQRTRVNLNTASVEVMMATIDGLDRASAQRLTQQRLQLRKGFENLAAIKALLPEKVVLEERHVAINSSHFEVTGQLRYEDSILREVSLVQRRGQDVTVLRRDRLSHE
ncbi:MAG: general secretion pathway protein GspK [Burkholderiales bacterium PBB6]|nr:MAG: general secretion pathway protein GspK [Burkholderiales bacterium PBB6]